MKNREIEAGAKAIGNDLQLPGGRRKKLARIVAEHLGWFDLAEARGMTWDDMIAVLAAAGVRHDNGRPLSRGTLSSAVWRKRQDAPITSHRTAGLPGDKAGDIPAKKRPSQKKRNSSKERTMGRGTANRAMEKAAVRRNPPSAGRAASSGVHVQENGKASNAVLAYMQRAARLRRSSDETD